MKKKSTLTIAFFSLALMVLGLTGCNGSLTQFDDVEGPATRAVLNPPTWKAILSLGWDWRMGSAGTAVYDPLLQVTKVHLGADSTVYNLYGTDGSVVGTVMIAGLSTPGEMYRGNITGDNSGVYPDEVLHYTAYKPNQVAEALLVFRLNEPTTVPSTSRVKYNFRLFINTKHDRINISQAEYAFGSYLEEYPGQYIIFDEFDTASYSTYNNFMNTMDYPLKTRQTPEALVIGLRTDDINNLMLFLNAIEIEKVQ